VEDGERCVDNGSQDSRIREHNPHDDATRRGYRRILSFAGGACELVDATDSLVSRSLRLSGGRNGLAVDRRNRGRVSGGPRRKGFKAGHNAGRAIGRLITQARRGPKSQDDVIKSSNVQLLLGTS